MQFTKLFNSILDSTIWQESAETKIVWITMLAMCERYGEVFASVPGLAARAGVTVSQVECALTCFLSPDKYSRTKDHEGRRIREIDGGWQLINHGKYRDLLSVEERKEYNRRKQAEYRAAKKAGVNDMSNNVKNCQAASAMSTHTEAEADTNENSTPLPPKGDGIQARRRKSLTQAEKHRTKHPEITPTMQRIGSWFGRQPDTKWSVAEYEALQSVNPSENEIAGMELFYTASIPKEEDHRRTAMITLLNNWPTDLDRARQHYRKNNQ